MEKSKDRRRTFAANAQTNLEWSFFDAHETLDSRLSYNPSQAMLAIGTTLTQGELGCYSSHFTVWREFLESPSEQLIVLEDDVVLDWRYLEFLIGHNLGELGVQYLRLFAKRPAPFRVVVPQFLEFNHDLIQFIGYAWGTQGYLLTRAGAQQFVHHLQVVRRNVDSSMDRAWDHGIANLAIFPFPLFEVMGPSSIESRRFEAREIPLSWRLKRFPYQVLERAKRKFGDRNVGPTISAAARREPRDYGR
jgi:glycosyl transferase family 25